MVAAEDIYGVGSVVSGDRAEARKVGTKLLWL